MKGDKDPVRAPPMIPQKGGGKKEGGQVLVEVGPGNTFPGGGGVGVWGWVVGGGGKRRGGVRSWGVFGTSTKKTHLNKTLPSSGTKQADQQQGKRLKKEEGPKKSRKKDATNDGCPHYNREDWERRNPTLTRVTFGRGKGDIHSKGFRFESTTMWQWLPKEKLEFFACQSPK